MKKISAGDATVISLGLLLTLAVQSALCASPQTVDTWKPPSFIRSQDCINVDRYSTESSLSGRINGPALISEFSERVDPEKILSLVDDGHSLLLIVDIRQLEQNVRKISRWVIVGDRENGALQRAIYRESVFMIVDKETVVVNVEAPQEALLSLQKYYSQWITRLKTLPTCFPGGSS